MKEFLPSKKTFAEMAAAVILLIIASLVSGCGSKEEQQSKTTASSTTAVTTTVTTVSTTTTTTTTKPEFKKFDKAKTMYIKGNMGILYKNENCTKTSDVTLKDNTKISVIAENKDLKVYKVKYKDSEYFIKKEYVTDKKKEEKKTTKKKEEKKETTTTEVVEDFEEVYEPAVEEPQYTPDPEPEPDPEPVYEESEPQTYDNKNNTNYAFSIGDWVWTGSYWYYSEFFGDSAGEGYNYVINNNYNKPDYSPNPGEEGRASVEYYS